MTNAESLIGRQITSYKISAHLVARWAGIQLDILISGVH
jgi:hypothetical protein